MIPDRAPCRASEQLFHDAPLVPPNTDIVASFWRDIRGHSDGSSLEKDLRINRKNFKADNLNPRLGIATFKKMCLF